MLIAIEGIDGSGKGTQSKILTDRLEKRGLPVRFFSFPYYAETFFGREVGRYLNGGYGQLNEVPAEFASLLYAGDRLEKKPDILDCLEQNHIVVCDRYVPSNLAHQTAKLPPERRPAMIDWISHVEYTIYGMPLPDLVFLLDLPPERSKEFVLKKKARDYTAEKLDLHEAASGYLERVSGVYRHLALEHAWQVIECENNGVILPIGQIADMVEKTVMERISRPSPFGRSG